MSEPKLDSSKYDIYLKTSQAGAMRTLSESLKEVLTDTNFHFDNDGLRIMTIDSKKVAIIYVKLDSKKFETYYCDKPISVGVSLMNLYKLMKTINNANDIISIFIEKKDPNKLCIKIENKEKKITDLSRLNLLDIDTEFLEIPDIQFETIFNMQCVDFQKHCRDFLSISDSVEIYTKNDSNSFIMNTVKGSFANKEIEIGSSDNSTDETKELIGMFSMEALNSFCKASSLCPTVNIYLKKDYPIVLLYSVASLGVIKFALGPKAESN